MPPLVTIGLPVYNEAPYVEDAVRSVFAQTLSDWELVIVDDGSTDGGPAWLKRIADPRVTFASDGQHRGLGARLNQVVSRAMGRYIARMDADDLMHPERIARQLSFLESHPEVDVVGCAVLSFAEDGEPVSARHLRESHEAITAAPLKGMALAHAATLARAPWWRAHPYDEVSGACEDVELWLGSYRNSRFANLPELLYFYRETESYSLTGYASAKAELSKRLWGHRKEFGVAATVAALVQWPRIAAYAMAHAVGADQRLVRRRGVPATDAEAVAFRSALQTIRETKLPLSPA